MAQKLLVGDKDTVLLLPAFEVGGVPHIANPAGGPGISIEAPTSALLNQFIPALTPAHANAKWGGNVTCAIIDDWTLGMTDSGTDDTRTLCSVGQSQDLTFYNFEAKMNFLRDEVITEATSEFNLARDLTQAPDIPYVIAHRIGYHHTAVAAAGQEWHFYYVWTDYPIPAATDGSNMQIGVTFIPKGILNFKAVLAS